jgi:hypothetical protein
MTATCTGCGPLDTVACVGAHRVIDHHQPLDQALAAIGIPQVDLIGALAQTCVPVMKNGVSPPAAALPFIQHVDLACYQLEAAALPTPTTLTLKHLNPVLANLPSHKVTLTAPAQLCLPVGKNGVALPPDVLRLVQFIDLECYKVDADPHPNFGVSLRQLNPQLVNSIPGHDMSLVTSPRQMCVPVQKNQQQIPTDILNIVQWVDLEKFTAAQPISLPAVSVSLNHLNPLFTTLPKVPVVLRQASALMVPVSKNGVVPPVQ